MTAVLLIVLGLIRRPASEGSPLTRGGRLQYRLGVIAVFFAGMALTAWLMPWRISLLGISNTGATKPMAWCAVCVLGWFVTSPRFAAAVRHRSTFRFYVAAAGLMWMLSLGPRIKYLGHITSVPAPYTLLLNLPGFDALRVPARFAMLTALCLSCAGGLAFARLTHASSRRLRLAATLGAALLALSDGWTRLNIETRPGPWAVQASEVNGAVLELPIGDAWDDMQAMYRSIYTGHPIVNGNSGHWPPWYNVVTIGLTRFDRTVLDLLSALGVRHVRIDTRRDTQHLWQKHFDARGDVTFVADDGVQRLYRLPPSAEPLAERPVGAPVPVTAIETNVNQDLAPAMRDGDLRTRWHTGPQKGTEEVTVDLGAAQIVRAIVILTGEFTSDAPCDLLIEVSDDRLAWSTVSRAAGGGAMLRAAFRDPKRVPFTIDLGDRAARFIRLRQLGADGYWYWSIPELTVLAPPR